MDDHFNVNKYGTKLKSNPHPNFIGLKAENIQFRVGIGQ